MLIDKALVLKGVAGAGAVGGVAAIGIAYGNFFDSELSKKAEEINVKLREYGIGGDCLLSGLNLQTSGDSVAYSKDCKLNKDQFKAIKFSNGPENGDQTVEGWNGEGEITLNISNKSEGGIKFLFKNAPSKLTIKGDGSKGDITIGANKETEFEEKEGRLSKVVDESLLNRLKTHNTKIVNLTIPDNCRFNENDDETSAECEISKNEFKKIKFSNKKDSEDLRVDGWNDENTKIRLRIEEKEDKSLEYTLSASPGQITLYGDENKGKIVIAQNKEYEFKEENGKLAKEAANNQSLLGGFNSKLGTMKFPIECRFDEGESGETLDCELSEDELKKIEFSNKGSGELTVKGITGGNKVKIKVSKDNASQEMRVEFKDLSADLIVLGDKNKGKIGIKQNGDSKLKESGGKLAKVTSNETTTITKLEGYNQELGKLDLPGECKFDVYESEQKMTCSITKEELKKVKFWNKEEGTDLTIDDENNFSSVEMEVKEESNKMKIIIKNKSKMVKISSGNNSFNLRKSESDEFEIRSDKLGQVRKKIDSEGTKLGLTCTYDGNGNSGKCKVTSGGKVNVLASSTEESGSVTIEDTNKDIFTFSEYEDTYNLITKFTYIGDTTPTSGTGPKLEQNCHYNSVNKEGGNMYLVKKTTGK